MHVCARRCSGETSGWGGGGHDFASSQRSVEMKRNIPLNVVLASSEIKVELGANT